MTPGVLLYAMSLPLYPERHLDTDAKILILWHGKDANRLWPGGYLRIMQVGSVIYVVRYRATTDLTNWSIK